jgi:apolipoprotein N-acyltransferase
MPNRATIFRILAIIATGLMVAALVPPYSFATLAWLCLVPLLASLWSLRGGHRAKKGFLIGFLAGVISFGIQLVWLGVVSWLGAILLPLYLALYWGAFGAFAATIGNPWHQKAGVSESPFRSLFNAFTHATIWAGLEWLRGWLFTGFGWNGLGVAFHETLVISQAADILGVAGLSLLVVFFQAVLVQVAHRLMKFGQDGIRRPRWDFAVTALFVGVVLAYGLLRISGEGKKDTISLKSLMIQINIPQDAHLQLWEAEKVHMAYEDETLKALNDLAQKDQDKLQEAIENESEGAVELSSPDWVLWPEAALTGRIIRLDDGGWGAWRQNSESIARVRVGGEFDLIYGVVEVEGEVVDDGLFEKENTKFYNSIAIQSPEDELQTYPKRHLVLFGETIPFVDSIPFLKKIYEQQSGQKYYGSFTVGPSLEPLRVNLNGEKVQIIPSVCFEDTVSRLTRKFIRQAPQIIVNLTNDGWFKESDAAAQHFANARFRAIELRRPMLRCANTGVSAAIDTIGSTNHPKTGKPQIIADEKGSSFVRGSLLTELKIPREPSPTLYAIIGDWGIIILSLIGGFLAVFSRNMAASPDKTYFIRNRLDKSSKVHR